MLLLAKIFVVPILICVATFVARRWGSFAGGLLAGLPLVAGPFTLFLAIEQGESFALNSLPSTLLGISALAIFCLSYSWLALKLHYIITSLLALFSYGIAIFCLYWIPFSNLMTYLFVISCILLSLQLMPKVSHEKTPDSRYNAEIPIKIICSTLLILIVTGISDKIGSKFSGFFAVFPISPLILSVFSHIYQSEKSAVILLRGFTVGLFGLSTFYISLLLFTQYLYFYFSFLLSVLTTTVFLVFNILIRKRATHRKGRYFSTG